MKLLYLNFADRLDAATGNSITALRAKYNARDQARYRIARWWNGNSEIYRVDCAAALQEMIAYLAADETPDPSTLTGYNATRRDVSQFFRRNTSCTKVMVAVHGMFDDVDYAYPENRRDGPRISYLKLADMLLTLLKDQYQSRTLKLSLVMCYGARSSAYRADHSSGALAGRGRPDLATSFAHKLYTQLCKQMKVTMSARTGAASFHSMSGKSQVESEFALRQRMQIASSPVRENEVERRESNVAYQEFFADILMPDNGSGSQREVKAADRQANELATEALEDLNGETGLLSRAKREVAFSRYSQLDAAKPTKSGKITYEYEPSAHRVVIRCKYPKPGRVVQRKSV